MKSSRFITMAISVAAALGGGCATTSSARSEPTTRASTAPAHEHRMGMMGGMCPMQVPGTAVASADVEGGVALTFTTGAGDVAELRHRVRKMAEMHDGHHAAGAAPGAQQGDHAGMRMGGGMMMPAATAAVEDVEGGARVVLRPNDPAQLGALREHARTRADRMARGECPMMSDEGQSPPSTGEVSHEHPSGPALGSMSHGMTPSTQASDAGR